MILLDTNVLSELMKGEPDARVTRWVESQTASHLYVSSISQAEILHGILLLPAGRRRAAIEAAAKAMFAEDFAGRVLAFGSDTALPYAQIAVERRRRGWPIAQFDAQIAAIARSRGFTLATRNVADFEDCGIQVVDPWK